jgi:hypothetical protein
VDLGFLVFLLLLLYGIQYSIHGPKSGNSKVNLENS